jgi:2-C-methyl-D-erythritol 4-phosphate cytidylyltransferase
LNHLKFENYYLIQISSFDIRVCSFDMLQVTLSSMNWLIIVAGGKGERMKLGHNKIFAELGEAPVLYWTLSVFEAHKDIDRIVIAAREEDREVIEKHIVNGMFKKVIQVTPAGSTRQETAFNALAWIKKHAKPEDLVGVHNAANPFVLDEEITQVYEHVKHTGAALLAFPAKDTIKITDENNQVSHTPTRTSCWCAQTPQVATFGKLYEAYQKAKADNFTGTDDTQLLERIGIKAKIVQCSQWNFKITFYEDLIQAQMILPVFLEKNVQSRDRAGLAPVFTQ